MDVKEEGLLSGEIGQHWYYKSKAKALTRIIRGCNVAGVLDVGAGSGFFSKYLLSHSAATKADCVDIAYEQDSEIEVAGKKLRYLRALQPSDADLVLLMDVLEHVDDDTGLLRDVIANTAPGTWFAITVPAFKFLWSGHDDFLGHKRRYTLSMLRRAVEAAGLKVSKLHYFYGLVFPLAVAVRMLGKLKRGPSKSDMRAHSAPVNSALYAICAAETHVMGLNKIMGLTVFCLCRKP